MTRRNKSRCQKLTNTYMAAQVGTQLSFQPCVRNVVIRRSQGARIGRLTYDEMARAPRLLPPPKSFSVSSDAVEVHISGIKDWGPDDLYVDED